MSSTKDEAENILGRKLFKLEIVLFEMYKDNPGYHFEKDKNGNLIAIKNESKI